MMSHKSFTKLYEELNKNPGTRPEPYEGEELYHYVRRMADYLEYKLSIVEDRIVKPDSAEAASKPEAASMLLEDISYEGEGWAILQCGAVTVKLGYTLLNIIVTCLGIGTRTANADAMLDTVRVLDAFTAINNEAAEGHTPPDWSEQ
jgi:hypothetical protein